MHRSSVAIKGSRGQTPLAARQGVQGWGSGFQKLRVGAVTFCPTQALCGLHNHLVRRRGLGDEITNLIEKAVRWKCYRVNLLLASGGNGRGNQFSDGHAGDLWPEGIGVGMHADF